MHKKCFLSFGYIPWEKWFREIPFFIIIVFILKGLCAFLQARMKSSGEIIWLYTQTTSKVGIWAMRKLSQFDDRKSPNINNMGWLTIAEFRCFGAAEMPTFEVVWV